jgi:hypothetical protein
MISRLLDWGFTRGAGKAGHVTGEVMAAGA